MLVPDPPWIARGGLRQTRFSWGGGGGGGGRIRSRVERGRTRSITGGKGRIISGGQRGVFKLADLDHPTQKHSGKGPKSAFKNVRKMIIIGMFCWHSLK